LLPYAPLFRRSAAFAPQKALAFVRKESIGVVAAGTLPRRQDPASLITSIRGSSQ
jgi:hypothetical protein